MRLADHVHFQPISHAGLLQVLAEYTVNQAHGREVLHAVEALGFEFLQVNIHDAEGVGATHTGQYRGVFDDGQHFIAHFHDDLIGVAIGQQAGQRAAARHTEATRVINKDVYKRQPFHTARLVIMVFGITLTADGISDLLTAWMSRTP